MNCEKIEFMCGCTVESAVNDLLKYKAKGISVYGDFNGHELHSDTVTMDGAYMEIMGKTKAEWDQQQKEWHENYIREQKEHEERIPELSKMWMERGRKVLSEDKLEYWDKIVPIRLSDLYHGMELGNTLDIIEALNNNDVNKAKEKFEEQGHSGMSASLVLAMVREFLDDKGLEFYNMMHR